MDKKEDPRDIIRECVLAWFGPQYRLAAQGIGGYILQQLEQQGYKLEKKA